MLKPYTRQQIQTNKVLSIVYNAHARYLLERTLTHEDILYNIIPNTKSNILLKDIITNTDSVVIVVDSVIEPVILDKDNGYSLDTLKCMYVGTELFTILTGVEYIIETNYRSVQDVYSRLCVEVYKMYIVDYV